MTAIHEPLVIARPTVAGETIEHKGPVIIKTFVENGVTVKAQNGGIILEQGGGNDIKLTAEHPLQQSLNQTNGVVSSGDIVINQSVCIINGVVVSSSTSSFNSAAPTSDVTVEGPLGRDVTIATGGSITLTTADNNLTARAAGSLRFDSVGICAKLKAGGSIQGGQTGSNSSLDAGGSIQIGTLDSGSTLSAGGSANIETVMDFCDIDAGGSLRITTSGTEVKANAGGSINIQTAAQPVTTRAGGSVTIAGQKVNKRGW